MSEVATATAPTTSAPSTGASESSSSSTASTPSATPAAETKESAPRTQRESSRELLRRQAKEALDKETPPATEGESSEAADKSKESATAPKDTDAEGKKVEAKPKAEPEPEDRLKIRETLKAIPDKKTREQIADLAFMGKELRDAGIKPADAKGYRELYPTLDSAKQAHQIASEAYDLAGAFHSTTPEGRAHFMDALWKANPNAANALVAKIAQDLPQLNRPAYQAIGQRTARAVIQNMRKAADAAAQRGDEARAHEYATAAQIQEEFLFPNGMQQPQRPANDPVFQENARLKAEFGRMQNERLAGARQFAFTSYGNALAAEAAKVVNEIDADNVYGEKARQRMVNEVLNSVRNQIGNNNHVRVATETLLMRGDGQGAAYHLINQALPLIPSAVANVVKDYADLFEKKQAVKEEKRAVVTAKKDVGAPASAPRAASNRPVDTRGMSTRQALRAIVSKRMSG